MTSRDDCIGCETHGFPCFRCADDVYYGQLGPGFLNGVQVIPFNTDSATKAVMEKWCRDHPNEHVVKQKRYADPRSTIHVFRAKLVSFQNPVPVEASRGV